MHTIIQNAAELIRKAQENKTPISPIRHLFDETDIEAAYAIQNINTQKS